MYLRQLGIEFEERDPNRDAEARKQFSRLKLPGVPSFLIGDEVVIGLNKERLKELLQQH